MESLTMVASGGERKGRWESKTHFFPEHLFVSIEFCTVCVCVAYSKIDRLNIFKVLFYQLPNSAWCS